MKKIPDSVQKYYELNKIATELQEESLESETQVSDAFLAMTP